MLKVTRSSSIVSCTARRLMIKTSFKKFAVEIARKRREMTRLQEDLADMLDHLAVIEARAKSANGKRYSTAEVNPVPLLDALPISTLYSSRHTDRHRSTPANTRSIQ